MMLVCYAKCTPCQFGEHPTEPHTWMESEDLEHDNAVGDRTFTNSAEDWAELARLRPCGCHCMDAHKPLEPAPSPGVDQALTSPG